MAVVSFFAKTPEKSLSHFKTDQSGRSCRIKNQRSNYEPDSQRDKVHTNIACRSRTAWSWTPLMSSTAKPIYREKELINMLRVLVPQSSTQLLCWYIIHKDNTKIFNYPGKVCSLQRGSFISVFSSISFTIAGVKNIVRYTKHFVRFYCTCIISNHWMRLSMMWRIMEIEEAVMDLHNSPHLLFKNSSSLA